MFRESTHHEPTAPYIIYPGLSTTRARAIQYPDCLSPEERLEFILLIVREEFAKKFEFHTDVMYSRTRAMPYALARMAFYYYGRMHCPTITLKELARFLPGHNQHHTTILHAFTAIQNIIDTRDELYYPVIAAINERLQ